MPSSQAYAELVKELRVDKSPRRLPCGVPEHANLALAQLLFSATQHVRIYTDRWRYDDGVKAAAMLFLERGGRLDVLLIDCEWPEGLGTIKQAVGSYSSPEAKRFAVTEGPAWRFEATEEQAIVCFNEPATASELREAFDKAWGRAQAPVRLGVSRLARLLSDEF